MFNPDITLVGDAASTRTYSLRGYPTGEQSLRGVLTAGLALPENLRISHSVSKASSAIPVDRHLVRLDLTKAHAVTGEAVTGSVYAVFELPRATITLAQIKDMTTQLKNFLDATNVGLLCNGEL
jgi:hypothetical protein